MIPGGGHCLGGEKSKTLEKQVNRGPSGTGMPQGTFLRVFISQVKGKHT